MNGIIKIAIIAAILIPVGGCGGNSVETNANASTANADAANLPDAATLSSGNTELIPYQAANTNGNPAANGETKVVNIDPKQLKPTNPATPAADNSEVTIDLNQKGAVETRIFKSNPVLAKVEKTTYGRDVGVKVYLKNGKVIPLAAEKIKNFTVDSAEQILQAAGVNAPKPVQNVETGAMTGAKAAETTETKPNQAAQTPNAPAVRAPTKP
jgi:hypothetical protein